MKAVISITITVLMAICQGQTTNYCDPLLCINGGPHIACSGPKTLRRTCGAGSFEVALNRSDQQLIVDLHNKLRNEISMGHLTNRTGQRFPQASRMATLQWDPELAYISAFNARRCVHGRDRCRNTATMKFVGQNIAIKRYYGMTIRKKQLLTDFINGWFNEFEDATPQQIARFPDYYIGPAIKQFTQIVSDRTSRIGCSMVSYNKKGFINKLFVCNYGLMNIIDQPVYVAGNVCSGCATGCNVKFPGLCSTSERVSNNP